MVYAKSTMSYCIALICPAVGELTKLAASLDIKGDVAELCNNSSIIEAVSKEAAEACKKGKLAGFETPKKYILISELWTPDNDMLTAVNKLKRKQIQDKHAKEISGVYV